MKPECSLEAELATQADSPVQIPLARKAAAFAWVGLLAGYLVFNRQFAAIGVPPVYIGEVVIALALLVHARRLPKILLESIQNSWAMKFAALFLVYGSLRALINYSEFGFWALRDSVICVYAVAAFLTPVLVRDLIAGLGPLKQMAGYAVTFTLAVASAAAVYAALIVMSFLSVDPWQSVKIDFVAAAVAICAWLWLITALRLAFAGNGRSAGACCLIAGAAGFLVMQIPVRAVWLAAGPLAAAGAAALAHTSRGKIILCAGVLVFAAVAGPQGYSKAAALFGGVNREYKLDENLSNVVDAKATAAAETGVLEKLMSDSRMNANDDGKRAKSLNVVWRAIFWVRAWHYTVHHAPLTGIGFGENLTNLLRGTPAWPLYIPSMELKPANRSPHNAHVTIFARLGFAGLVVWLMMLGCVSWTSLKALWRLRKSPEAESQTHFWNGLGLFGVWLIFLCAMSFGVVLEGPMGGIWFWSVTGLLACWSRAVCAESTEAARA